MLAISQQEIPFGKGLIDYDFHDLWPRLSDGDSSLIWGGLWLDEFQDIFTLISTKLVDG